MATSVPNFLRVYLSPIRFFTGLDVAAPYGWSLVTLLLLLGLAGYVVVAAGLVERETDLATERDLAEIERLSVGEVSQDQLNERFRIAREAAGFWRVIASGCYILSGPAEVVGRILVGAAVAFVVVALAGRKPAYQGLIAIFTFAAYTELLRQAVVVPLMLGLRSTHVETSAAVLLYGRAEVSGWLYSALQTIDPFKIWFCCLAAIGINRSGQLGIWGAAGVGSVLWLGGSALYVATRFLAGFAGMGGMS